MNKRKILFLSVSLAVYIWVVHVIHLNQEYPDKVVEYHMKETFLWKDVFVTPLESHLFTVPEYEEYMQIHLDEEEKGQMNKDCRILCLKLDVTNKSGVDINWDVFMDAFGYGFESCTWCSVFWPELGNQINRFHSDVFQKNESQTIWLMTVVNSSCFSEKTWNRIHKESFYYVLDVAPNKTRICMK